jgi:hypothetical protein
VTRNSRIFKILVQDSAGLSSFVVYNLSALLNKGIAGCLGEITRNQRALFRSRHHYMTSYIIPRAVLDELSPLTRNSEAVK